MRVALCAVLFACACQAKIQGDTPSKKKAPHEDVLTAKSVSGPISATVTLSPAKPTLGDSLELLLEVKSEAGVEVQMPAFGDALGRFAIAEFVPRSSTDKAGNAIASQRYVLETPMSGKQTIPSLLVEFTDRRPGQAGDAGVELQELLTEELRIDVASIIADGESLGELRPARGPLKERRRASGWLLIGLLGMAGAGLAGGVGFVLWRRRAVVRTQISAFDAAMKRLRKLEAGGLPLPADADQWYVDLSSIVRRYLEDRFALRAPELTTEEFLRVAGQSEELRAEHRSLLHAFLAQCDRVKFAAYKPESTESEQALATARRFLDDTRLERASEAPAETRRAA